MNIKIKDLWSADFDPSDGQPEDIRNFTALISIELYEESWKGSQLFYLTVMSPSSFANIPSGTFLKDTLVIETFSWKEIEERVSKLLSHCLSCSSFEEIENQLSGFLKYANQ